MAGKNTSEPSVPAAQAARRSLDGADTPGGFTATCGPSCTGAESTIGAQPFIPKLTTTDWNEEWMALQRYHSAHGAAQCKTAIRRQIRDI